MYVMFFFSIDSLSMQIEVKHLRFILCILTLGKYLNQFVETFFEDSTSVSFIVLK